MSLYVTDPGTPAVTIRVYPKRHRFRGPLDDLTLKTDPQTEPVGSAPDLSGDVRYGDFFRSSASTDGALVSSGSDLAKLTHEQLIAFVTSALNPALPTHR